MKFLVLAAILGIVPAAEILAAPVIPNSADPSLIKKQFEEQQPQPISRPDNVPPPPITAQGESGPGVKFLLKQVVIEGSTVYSQEKLAEFYKSDLGKNFTLGDAQRLVDNLTAQYRSDGYILSQAILPPQDVYHGVLRIKIIEGYVEHVTINGDLKDANRELLRTYADKIEDVHPLTLEVLERYMLLMNDLPGVTATSVIHPSDTTLGAANLIVTAERKSYDGSYSMDNRGTQYVGPFQHTFMVDENSLAGMDERTTVRGIVTSPTTEMRYYDVSHEEMIGSEGTKLVLEMNHAATRPGQPALTSIDVNGTSDDYIVKLMHPFLRSRAENVNGRIAFDVHDSQTNILNGRLNEDRLRVLRTGGSYDIADAWNGSNIADAEIGQGLSIFNPTDPGALRSRPHGTSDFTKINVALTRIQQIDEHLSLSATSGGQFSDAPLLSSEQFSLGGTQFGGAYDPSELTGDDGIAAKLELRYGDAPGSPYLNYYQFYTYSDVGEVWNRVPVAGTPANANLASAGVGVRAEAFSWLSGNLEVAKPLTKEVTITHNHDPRLFVSLTGSF